MKQILLLAICAISFQFMTNAQTVTISPGEIVNTLDLDNLAMDDDPSDINGHSVVSHSESGTKTFVWVRNEVFVPDGWEISICDINSCWFHTVSTKEFDLEQNFEGTLDVHAYPGGNPGVSVDEVTTGEAIVELTVSEVGNPSNTMTAVYTLSLTGTVNLEIIEKEDVKVYPNPTTNFFKLTDTEVVDRLIIRNLVGKEVKAFEVANGANYDISELPTGIYLITLMNEENIVRTVRMSKK